MKIRFSSRILAWRICDHWWDIGMSGLATNWVRLASNGTNLALLKISFSTYWLAKLIWKSPRFVPFGANLTQFGTSVKEKEAEKLRVKHETVESWEQKNFIQLLTFIFYIEDTGEITGSLSDVSAPDGTVCLHKQPSLTTLTLVQISHSGWSACQIWAESGSDLQQTARMFRFGPKVGQIGPKWDIFGICFSDFSPS